MTGFVLVELYAFYWHPPASGEWDLVFWVPAAGRSWIVGAPA